MSSLEILDRVVPISDFNHGRASAAFNRVSDGKPIVVMRRNTPSYVIVTTDDYRRAAEAEEDLALIKDVLAQMKGCDPNKTIGRNEIMAKYGITEKDLESIDEVEFE